MSSTYTIEREIQHDIIEWFTDTYPDYIIYSTPNEAAHQRWNYYTYTGALRGAPDLTVVVCGKVFFVETKTEKGVVSDEQKSFSRKCDELGVNYHVVRSLDDFIEVCREELPMADFAYI